MATLDAQGTFVSPLEPNHGGLWLQETAPDNTPILLQLLDGSAVLMEAKASKQGETAEIKLGQRAKRPR